MFSLIIACSSLFLVVLVLCTTFGQLISDGAYFIEITFGSLSVIMLYVFIYSYFFLKKFHKTKLNNLKTVKNDIMALNKQEIPKYLSVKVHSGLISESDIVDIIKSLDLSSRSSDNLIEKTLMLCSSSFQNKINDNIHVN
jgi:hypothetical protein